MTLPASGPITFGNVNTELGNSATAALNLGSASVRSLFGVASGAISLTDGYGCASIPAPGASDLGVYCSDWGGYYTGVSQGYYLYTDTTTVGCQYKVNLSSSPCAASFTDGYSNTYNGGYNSDSDHPAMCYAGSLSRAGFTDWYNASGALSAGEELQNQWLNRSCGSIPAYGSGGYWSSAQISNGYRGWGVCFATGSVSDCASPRKTCTCCVRAIRRQSGA